MNPIIIVHGEERAKAIARYYGVQCRPTPNDPTSWEVDASDRLEHDICHDEDACQESLDEINAAMDVNIVIDDLEF